MVIYIVFGITEGETCYSLIGISMIFLGVVMITLQPYRSRKANTYNTILILFTAVACFSITLFNDTEVEAHSIAGIVLTFIGVIYISPTVILIAYVTYCISDRLCKMC